MANAIYQKFVAGDNGAWVLTWGGNQQAYASGISYYTSYDFNANTGQFTPTGSTFSDTIQDQRTGYRLSGSTPVQIYTYADNSFQNGKNLICNGTIRYLPDRSDRYYKGRLIGTVELPHGSVPENGVQDGYWYVFQRMVTPLWARTGGVWHPGYAFFGKVDGVWKNEAKLSARVGGIWY